VRGIEQNTVAYAQILARDSVQNPVQAASDSPVLETPPSIGEEGIRDEIVIQVDGVQVVE
jgi:hypothetical protein